MLILMIFTGSPFIIRVSKHDAEDLVQDVFLKLLGNHVELKPNKEKTYLLTMTANKGGEFKKAIITADLGKSFVSVNVLPRNDDLELNNLTKADIEKLADQIVPALFSTLLFGKDHVVKRYR